MMEYFIIENNGQQAGPFSLEQLVQKAITPETLVWAQGMKDWTPAWKIAELKTVLETVEAIKANTANKENAEGTSADAAGNNGTEAANFQAANQQGFQQAQQEAYQQGFQHGAAMNQGYRQEPEKKKSSKTLWKIILGLIVLLFLVFAITNPGPDAHKEKVKTEAAKAIETSDNNFFTQSIRSIAKMMAGSAIDEVMNQLFEYHNYIVCSKGTVEFNGKQHTVSFGILGSVYTMNADDMVKALEGADNLQIEETTSSSTDESPSVSDNNSDGSEEDGLGASVQKKLEDKANQAMDQAADKVSKKLEEKINQKLDEATDSSTVEKILDKILELI
jgi:flagellar biosynthesis/type III secretory pathway protein FliH